MHNIFIKYIGMVHNNNLLPTHVSVVAGKQVVQLFDDILCLS